MLAWGVLDSHLEKTEVWGIFREQESLHEEGDCSI